MNLAKTLFHYITLGQGLNGECKLELNTELEDLEKTLYQLQKDVRTLKRGVEPLEKEIKDLNVEAIEFKKRLFSCFNLGEDGTTVTVNSDKILSLFGEDAYCYLMDC